MSFFGLDGVLAGGVACDDLGKEIRPQATPPELLQTMVQPTLVSGRPLVDRMLLGGRLALVGVAPVLRSNASGPPTGVLVVVKYTEEAYAQQLSQEVQTGVSLFRPDIPPPGEPTEEFQRASRLFLQGTDRLTVPASQQLALWLAIRNRSGQVAMIVHTHVDREWLIMGWRLLSGLFWSGVAVVMVAGVLFVVLLDRMILCRLTALRLRIAGDSKFAVSPRHTDEIAVFEAVITQAVAMLQRELAERRKVEEELRDTMHQRNQLARIIVHDMRSPLTGVIGNLELLQHRIGGDQPGLRKLVDRAMTTAESLIGMVNELLEIERLESGQADVRRTSTRIAVIIDAAIHRLGSALDRHRVVTQCDATIPEVQADADLLTRVIGNLLGNAAKYSPPGTEITVTATRSGAVIRITVSDQGPGIPQDQQPYVFEKFSRLAKDQDRLRSTGIGLSFVKLAVEAQGGRVLLDSTPGKGSAFSIELPVPEPAL